MAKQVKRVVRRRLPDKLSELLTVALADLQKAEADPRYEINMDEWHAPVGSRCAVCLGGAVLAFSLKTPPMKYVNVIRRGKAVRDKLFAIDYLRRGDVVLAAQCLGISDLRVEKAGIRPRQIVYYKENPKRFKQQLRRLASDLKAAGL